MNDVRAEKGEGVHQDVTIVLVSFVIAICDNGRDEGSKNLKILRTSFKYRPSIIINNLLPAELTKITEEEMLSFCPFSSRCTTYLVHIEICVIIQLAVRKGASATF